jgi:hypothetical protein
MLQQQQLEQQQLLSRVELKPASCLASVTWTSYL